MKLRLEFTADEWASLAEDCEHVGTCGHLTLFHDDEGWCSLCEEFAPYYATGAEAKRARKPLRIVFPIEIVLPDPPLDVNGHPARRQLGPVP